MDRVCSYLLALALRRWCNDDPARWRAVLAAVEERPNVLRAWCRVRLAYSETTVKALEAVQLIEEMVAKECVVPRSLGEEPGTAQILMDLVRTELAPLEVQLQACPPEFALPVAKALWSWGALYCRPGLKFRHSAETIGDVQAHLRAHPEDAERVLTLLPLGDEDEPL